MCFIFIGFTFNSCTKSSSQLGSTVDVVNVSVSDPTAPNFDSNKFFKLLFLISWCYKVFIFSISTIPFTIFRAFLRKVKFFCFDMGNFLILGQEPLSNDLQLLAEKIRNIFACSLSYSILSWYSCEASNDLFFLSLISYI